MARSFGWQRVYELLFCFSQEDIMWCRCQYQMLNLKTRWKHNCMTLLMHSTNFDTGLLVRNDLKCPLPGVLFLTFLRVLLMVSTWIQEGSCLYIRFFLVACARDRLLLQSTAFSQKLGLDLPLFPTHSSQLRLSPDLTLTPQPSWSPVRFSHILRWIPLASEQNCKLEQTVLSVPWVSGPWFTPCNITLTPTCPLYTEKVRFPLKRLD